MNYIGSEDWSNGCWKFSYVITGIHQILNHILK